MTKKYRFSICSSDGDGFITCKYFYYDHLSELNEFLSHHLNYFNYSLSSSVTSVCITRNFGGSHD